MNILFIAPIAPPVTGQSLASKIFLNFLLQLAHCKVQVIDFKKPRYKNLLSPLFRVFKILIILKDIYRNRNGNDVIYLTISESILGNIKDLCTYFILRKHLSKLVIHLHGGASFEKIFSRGNILLFKINKYYLNRLKAIIVLGETQKKIFDKHIDNNKLFIVKNFAEDIFFVSPEKLNKKESLGKLNILFLSSLIGGKGYLELRDSYFLLPSKYKSLITINFAGGFKDGASKKNFLNSISGYPSLVYKGFLDGIEKYNVLYDADIFCLPTYYPHEGQPISILEAYAAGCLVITTEHSGIPDIFTDGMNGFYVNKKSPESIANVLVKIIEENINCAKIGFNNTDFAKSNFRTSIYNNNLYQILFSNFESSK
jgi:glycosyltransferase involved in cell wall biosynthesis